MWENTRISTAALSAQPNFVRCLNKVGEAIVGNVVARAADPTIVAIDGRLCLSDLNMACRCWVNFLFAAGHSPGVSSPTSHTLTFPLTAQDECCLGRVAS